MTLTNHLLTGAALAKFLPLPIAIPLAFLSHFALDALPHFGYETLQERTRHPRLFKGAIIGDLFAALVVSLWLIKINHISWLLVGVIAYSPDLMWLYRFTITEKFGTVEPTKGNRFVQFHSNIQKYERIWGLGVEGAYGLIIFALTR